MKRQFFDGFLLFLAVFMLLNVVRSAFQLWNRDDILTNEESHLNKIQQEHERLKSRLAQVKTPQYQEKVLRERLNGAKEGETVILMPTLSPVDVPTPTLQPTVVPWRQWSSLFF